MRTQLKHKRDGSRNGRGRRGHRAGAMNWRATSAVLTVLPTASALASPPSRGNSTLFRFNLNIGFRVARTLAP